MARRTHSQMVAAYSDDPFSCRCDGSMVDLQHSVETFPFRRPHDVAIARCYVCGVILVLIRPAEDDRDWRLVNAHADPRLMTPEGVAEITGRNGSPARHDREVADRQDRDSRARVPRRNRTGSLHVRREAKRGALVHGAR